VPVFSEKFLLPVLAALVGGVVILNPMKWDWQSRVALFVAIAAFAFLLSHQLHLRNEAIRTGSAPTTATPPMPTIEQSATESTCSNIVAGKDAKVDCAQKQENPNATKSGPKGP
jgi:hypothetical protein